MSVGDLGTLVVGSASYGRLGTFVVGIATSGVSSGGGGGGTTGSNLSRFFPEPNTIRAFPNNLRRGLPHT